MQLSTLELNAEVERLLQENPLLEKADDEEAPGPPRDFLVPVTPTSTEKAADATDERAVEPSDLLIGGDGDWGSSTSSNEDDDEAFLPQQVATSSLRDHLNAQLALLNLPLRDRQIVAALIDALDEDSILSTRIATR